MELNLKGVRLKLKRIHKYSTTNMSDSFKPDCPFCDKPISYSIWFKHIVNQHTSEFFDTTTPEGRMNVSALTFKTDRSSLPTIKVKGGKNKSAETRYVCWACPNAFSKDSTAKNHLPHLKKSLEVATELKETLTLNPLETPPLPSENTLTNYQELAYQKVILDLAEQLEYKMWIEEKWNKARDIPEIDELIQQMPEIESPTYDLKDDHKKEAKYINLDRSHLEKVCKQKLP